MDAVRSLTFCLIASLSISVAAEETIRLSSFERFRPTGTAQASNRTSHGPAGLPSQSQRIVTPAPTLPTTFVINETAKAELPNFDASSTERGSATKSLDPLQKKLNQIQQDNAVAKQEIDSFISGDKPSQEAKPNTQANPITKSKDDKRHLNFSSATTTPKSTTPRNSPYTEILAWRPTAESLTTMGSGLSIVLGLLMICLWMLRKSMPKSSRVLPQEVAEVLGKVVLSNRRTAQLLKLGNKLLLVSITPDGAETLAEVTDPEEVQHILLLSDQAQGRGSNAEFEKVFQQLANGPSEEGFLGNEAPSLEDSEYDPRSDNPDSVHYDAQRLAAAYANTPGGRSHAA